MGRERHHGQSGALADTAAPRELKKFRPKVNSTLAKLVNQCILADADKRPESAAAAAEAIRLVAHEDGEATIKAAKLEAAYSPQLYRF